MARIQRFVNTASTAGGDGTTNATTGANRAYPTLRAALVGITDNLTLLTAETVTIKGLQFANIALEIICDKAGGDDTSSGGSTRTNLFTGTCDSTHRVLIRAADNSWPTGLKRDTGYCIKYSVTTNGLGALTADNSGIGRGMLAVAGIQAENTNASATRHGILDQSYGASDDGARNEWFACIGRSASGDGFRRGASVNIYCCAGVDSTGEGMGATTSANNCDLMACLAEGNGGLGIACGTTPDGTTRMYNCVSFNNTGTDYTSGMTLEAGTNNASEDGTHPGTSGQTISASDGVDMTQPSTNNYMPTSGGVLKDLGANLVSLSLMANAVDAAGTARPQGAAWDIGPLEFVAADTALNAAAQSVASASAGLNTAIVLGASAADQASSSAALTAAITMAAAAVSQAAATGLLSAQIRLAANAQDVASAQGTFGGAVLQAAATDVATAVAALTASIRFNAQALGVATAGAELTNWATVTLAGTPYVGAGSVYDPNFWLDDAPQVGTTLYYDSTHIIILPSGEIGSDLNDCTAIVQFFGPNGLAIGLVVVTPKLVAYARDTVSASAQLSTAIQLAAAANALATSTASLSTGAGIAAAATDEATATANLLTAIPLSALAQSVVSATAALTAQIKLQADAIATATGTANLNGVISLNAAGQAVSTMVADLLAQIRFAGNAQASAAAGGALTAQVRLDAIAQSIVSAAAALSTSITLGGSANDVSSASAALTTARPLVAAAIDIASAVALLSTGIRLDANAHAIVSAAAQLEIGIALIGDARSEASATAELTDVIQTPPIGAYKIDPRYVIAVPRWSFLPLLSTPRFRPKDPDDGVVLTFDLSRLLDSDEQLQGPITLTVRTLAGSDASPRSLLVGVPSYDIARRKILQPVHGGVNRNWYFVKVSAATNNSQKQISLGGILPVME